MAGRDEGGVGSARRRRDRQLPAWHRRVKLTVAMELATALHHSAQPAGPVVVGPSEGEVHETYDAPRRLKAPLLETPPEQLSEALGPQGAAVTVGYVAAWAPLWVVPTLYGDDCVDGTTVSFLWKVALAKRKEEEEMERRRELEEKAKHEAHMRILDRRFKAGGRLSSPEGDGWRRWKWRELGLPPQDETRRKGKKRRKKKHPKFSSARAPHTW